MRVRGGLHTGAEWIVFVLASLTASGAFADKANDYRLISTQSTAMEISARPTTRRFSGLSEQKVTGATYTPKALSDFVAQKMIDAADIGRAGQGLKILDPAVGDGELLLSLLEKLESLRIESVEVWGFETDAGALGRAKRRISTRFPKAVVSLQERDFLSYVSATCEARIAKCLLQSSSAAQFDLVIANPPYVRTQIMGSSQARQLAKEFGLTGRVDLYHAFILAIATVLKPRGIAGVITSNRFMTTRSGASIRRAAAEHVVLRHVWDLGDSKIFDAAVLPAVLLAEGKNGTRQGKARFTSIYETAAPADIKALDQIDALRFEGVVEIEDGRRFRVRHGVLGSGVAVDAVWRIATKQSDAWLEKVAANTWATFGSLGKIRVGIKTTADKVFIRNDWTKMDPLVRPELLRPLLTHHVARRFRALDTGPKYEVLYPHLIQHGRRVTAELSTFPKAANYLQQHRATLERRSYVIEAGRAWYEIWVPQDPAAWSAPKLVFRDISEQPIFWLDFDGSVVNGDCYWLACTPGKDCELLWLAAAVANSTFIEAFYDHKFHNKLYAGRRRFITQYVEAFPLPDPRSALSQEIIQTAKDIYERIETTSTTEVQERLNQLVWSVFGLPVEEIARKGNL